MGSSMNWRTWADLHREEMQRRRREQVERITLAASAAGLCVVGVLAWLKF